MEQKHIVFVYQGGSPVFFSQHRYESDAIGDASRAADQGFDGFIVPARVFEAKK